MTIFESAGGMNPSVQGLYRSQEAAMQNVGKMLGVLGEFPKNIMPKTGAYSWDQNKKIKECFERLEQNKDFEMFRKICFEKIVKHPFINSEWVVDKNGKIKVTEETKDQALFFFAQLFTIMQLNSEMDHYIGLEEPPKSEK